MTNYDTLNDSQKPPQIFSDALKNLGDAFLSSLGVYPESFSMMNKNGFLAVFDGTAGYEVSIDFFDKLAFLLQKQEIEKIPLVDLPQKIYESIGTPNFETINLALDAIWSEVLIYESDENSGFLRYKMLGDENWHLFRGVPSAYALSYFREKIKL